jgi:hypothetical protein
MVTLDSGNVLLKPSHRRQVLSHLRRAVKLGQRLGNFVLNIRMFRNGRCCEVQAKVQDRAGSFDCRVRRHSWQDAVRDLVRQLASMLAKQRLAAAVA